ncbi:MAG: glycosyltransferase family 87 protein [Bryobacterales bacterium]
MEAGLSGDFKAKIVIGCVAILAIGGMLFSVGGRERALAGVNDFIPLYVAATTVGTDGLYAVEPYMDFQNEHFGAAGESLRFTRLPYYSVLLAPLRLLDYPAAYALWSLLRLAAVVAFVWLWTGAQSKADTFLFVAISMPIYMALMTGQDTLLLLPLLALALRYEATRPFVAGVALSLCSIKFHLFTLIPVLLIAQRRWDIGKGFLAGGGALVALSFVGGGWTWPADYLHTLLDDSVHPGPKVMPNLHGLEMPFPVELGLCVSIAVTSWFAMRRMSFDVGLAAALPGGILLSYHSYVMDTVILVPALMIVMLRAEAHWMRLAAVILLSPMPALLLLSGPPESYVMQAGLLLLLGSLLYTGLRRDEASHSLQPAESSAEAA